MKLNETLIIGLALVAALVFSKGGAVSSIFKKSSLPLLPLENQNQSKITSVIVTPPQFTRIDITEQLRNISSLELEKNLTPLQNQLSQTQKYISDQEKIINKRYGRGQAGAFLYPSDVQNIQNKYGTITNENTIQYYENLIASESALGYGGQFTGGSSRKFPKLTGGLTKQYNILIARRNVAKADEILTRQQGQIDLINEEYQTRFGGLSRYG